MLFQSYVRRWSYLPRHTEYLELSSMYSRAYNLTQIAWLVYHVFIKNTILIDFIRLVGNNFCEYRCMGLNYQSKLKRVRCWGYIWISLFYFWLIELLGFGDGRERIRVVNINVYNRTTHEAVHKYGDIYRQWKGGEAVYLWNERL